MAQVGVRTVVDGKLVKKGLQNLSAEIPKIGRSQIYNVFVRSRMKLKKPGKQPKYPIPWVSVRQKIKVIILLKHTLGMPYRRTGLYQKGFKVVKEQNGYSLVNESERASYIGGDSEGRNQTRPFWKRYPVVRDVIDTEFDKLPTAVVAHIQLEAIKNGFEATTQ